VRCKSQFCILNQLNFF